MLVAENGRESGTVKCIDFHYDNDDISDYDEKDVDDQENKVNCSVRNKN